MKITIINLLSIFITFMSSDLIAQTVTTITGEIDASGGISVDTSGVIYVADFGAALDNSNGTNVYKVTLNGEVTVFVSGFVGAAGNAFDSKGNLFQSHISAASIVKITPDGTVSTFTTTHIQSPVGVTVDEDDNVYSTNCTFNPGVIVKTTPAGVSTIFAEDDILSCPNGLTIDDDGNIYTSNFGGPGGVIKITQAGVVSLLASIPGNRNGHLIFGNGRLYVVAMGANQIYEVSLTGDVKLLAGTGSAGNADGDALQSTWNIPNGIGISPSGTELYINDKVVGKGSQLNPVVIRVISGIDTTPSVSVDEESNALPSDYSLSNAYPNPFNPETVIEYTLSKSTDVNLIIYDLSGKEVAHLVNSKHSPGSYKVTWDASDNSSGVYLYRLQADDFVETKKMVLLK